MQPWWYVVYSTFIALGLVATGFFWSFYIYRIDRKRARETADQILENARAQADLIKRKAEAEGAELLGQVRAAFDQEIAPQRNQLMQLTEDLVKRQQELITGAQAIEQHRRELDQRQAEVVVLHESAATERARAAGLTPEEARQQILREAREAARAECARVVRLEEDEARRTSAERARQVTVLAIEKNAASVVTEVALSTVNLPTEDMKGRLIGKEGRNIRSFETVAGVNLLIDESPNVVEISCADPVRREIARQTLVRLIGDGRIHPGRIEEVHAEVKASVENIIAKAGEEAIERLGLRGVSGEVVALTGRLKFRTSYAQNVLEHSLEMAGILSTLSAELGLDPVVGKRIGLFHDLGKAFSHEKEGSHALLGADFLRRHGEDPVVVNAVAAHHGEVPAESLYAHLCVAADAITAARPGARQENAANYLRRLETLESIANAFPGVQSSFAIYAGREIRVLVDPGRVDDEAATTLAREIGRKIRETIDHGGPVRVTVIRETRAVEITRY
jgi:ribonucrease Y